jgi:hypothetical protein
MTRRMYKRLAKSTAKWWLIIGGLLGVGALPCPECGTPMIFHVWPIVGLVLAVRVLKKRYQEEDQQAVSKIVPTEPGLPASAVDNGEGR